MSALDFCIILIAVLLYLAFHFPLAYVISGTLIALILVRLLVVREPFFTRRAAG